MRMKRSAYRSAPAALALAMLAAISGAAAAPGEPKPPDATVPVPPPLPPGRPDELKPAAPPASTPAPPAPPPAATPAPPTPNHGTAIQGAPMPPERPAELKPEPAEPRTDGPAPAEAERPDLPVPPPLPPARPAELSGAAALALKVAPPDDTACRVRLTRLGVAFEPLPPLSNGQCGAPLPLKVTALGDGIGLPQPLTLVCKAAEALARWSTEVQVAADRELKQPLKSIDIGTTYECRGQNHGPDAKLSEHAFANGIDVMGFGFAGRASIPVKGMPEGSPEGRFLDDVRAKSCGFFRTVLGPGSDAAHANHLHLDERERSGGHRLCQ